VSSDRIVRDERESFSSALGAVLCRLASGTRKGQRGAAAGCGAA